jgi:hypothetical protein
VMHTLYVAAHGTAVALGRTSPTCSTDWRLAPAGGS